MPRPARTVLAALSLTVLLGVQACGTVDDLDAEQEQAAKVSRAFLEAVVDEDAEAACALMAIRGEAVAGDPTWVEACVAGIEESNDDPKRLDAYERQLEDEPKVSDAGDDEVSVTWASGNDVTTHTMVKIDGEWLLTQ